MDKNKIQSRPPIGHLLFTFPLLLKYKTDFPGIINLSQRFTAQAVRSFAAFSFFNEKCCTVVAWCEQYGDPSIVLTERERKDRFEHRAKNQMAVFNLVHFFSKR